VGGIATWTKIIHTRGLGEQWHSTVVDTRMRGGKTVADQNIRIASEATRTILILLGLLRILLFNRPTVVHLNSSLSERGVFRDALVAAVTRVFRVPLVTNLNGNFLPGKHLALSGKTRAAYRYIFRRSQQIIALSADGKQGVHELGNYSQKTIVLPLFVDDSAIPKKIDTNETRFTIGYLGTLIETKGILTIYEAATRLPELKFVLIGDRPATSNSVKIIECFSKLPNVTLTGPLIQEKAHEELAKCDALMFPSHSEGFPLAVAESMAIGLPVIASPVGAIPEMVDTPQGGYLIAPKDVDGYVKSIIALSTDPTLARELGSYNENKARDSYAYENVITRWRDVYTSLI